MAKVLGVTVEDLLSPHKKPSGKKRHGPAGKVGSVFEVVSKLPRRQQDKIVEVVHAMIDQYERRNGKRGSQSAAK